MRVLLKNGICFIFFLIVFHTGNVKAQDSSAVQLPKVWSLANCISYAKRNNININSLRLGSKTAEQSLIAAKAAKYPNLTASVSQDLSHYKTGMQSSSGYGVNSGITLFNGGYLNNDVKSKTLNEQAANLSVDAAENDMTLQVTQAYLNILLVRENITYLNDLLGTSAALVKQGEQRLAAGTVAKKDLLQLQATLANDKYTLVSSQNQLQQNVLALKQLLQLPSSTDFTVATSDTTKLQEKLMDLNSAQDKALQIRPEVKGAELNLQMQQVELEKAKAGLRPVLGLTGALNTGFNSANIGGYPNQLNNSFNQSIGLTLSIPIFDRKITKTNVAKANLQIQQAKLSLLDTRTTLSQSVEKALLNVQNANSQYVAASEQFNYTKEALRISGEELRLGSSNTFDYLQQKTLYVQALQAYVQAKYTANLYTKIYDFYTGVPITE